MKINNKNEHVIKCMEANSIAEEVGLEVGDKLLEISGQIIEDIFDYQFLIGEEVIELVVQKQNGEIWEIEIEKELDEDLGIEFENSFMDEYRSCTNGCIFCFVDQMPKGMRETLYFKDDDSRLSFLQGNYVTLTNMSEKDIDRIIKYKLAPINISVHTCNEELRVKMLKNKFAGNSLSKIDRLYEAGISMNGQIVLCKGVNDKEELEFTISNLSKYLPFMESVSVVPVGLSKHREGLYPLEPFTKEDAMEVLDTIHKWQEICYEKHGLHFIHASDEWYILAERELPREETYDGYLQLENGVGMLRLLEDEVLDAIQRVQTKGLLEKQTERTVSIATGKLAYPYLVKIANQLMEVSNKLSIHVYEIRNEFFGELITVSGLLTAGDIMKQLEGRDLGSTLYLPQNVLRSGEEVFLDDFTVGDVQKALQVTVDIVKSSGYDLVEKLLQVSLQVQ